MGNKYTEAQKKASKKYVSKYANVYLRISKEMKESINEYCNKYNISISSFAKTSFEQQLKQDYENKATPNE